MKQVNRTMVEDAVFDAGLEEDAIYDDYSGRFMYGEKCFGITGSEADASEFLVSLAARGDEEADLAKSLARAQRSDSLGLRGIFYFPGFTLK